MSNTNNKYKSLLSNTFLFALSTFGPKAIAFILTPLYTNLMGTETYGSLELFTVTCNFILPIMYLSISESIIRFGLERSVRKTDVYTTGITVVFAGFGVFLLFTPLLQKIPEVGEYTKLMCLYVLASALRTVTTHFIRALGHVRLFALDGGFTTLLQTGLNILLLVHFKMGARSVIIATILSDSISALLLTIIAKTYRYFSLKEIDWSVFKKMLAYSIPLVPTALAWSITNLSDRYFITYFVSIGETGIYSIAGKIPYMITLVSAVFIQAWQISAFTEYDTPGGKKFYGSVFRSYYTLIFLASSGLIMLARPLMKIMNASYYEGWKYVPFLVLAVSFSCLVTFLGTIYNAEKKNGMVTVTTILGAVLNIILNWLTIPKWGSQGAAVATFVSYLVVFIIRLVDTKKYVDLEENPVKLAITLGLLLLQTAISLYQVPFGILYQALIFIIIFLLNAQQFMFMVRMLAGGLYKMVHRSKK